LDRLGQLCAHGAAQDGQDGKQALHASTPAAWVSELVIDRQDMSDSSVGKASL
jgi:hypothetical protein